MYLPFLNQFFTHFGKLCKRIIEILNHGKRKYGHTEELKNFLTLLKII